MKTYLFLFLASFLFLFTACQQDGMEEIQKPIIREINGTRAMSTYFLPSSDFRFRYNEEQKTITQEIGEYNFYPEMLASARFDAGFIDPYDELILTGITLSVASFMPQDLHLDTWKTFTEEVEVIYTPTDGTPPVSLSTFSDNPFQSLDENHFQTFSLGENLIDLMLKSPGEISFKFSFSDRPNEEIILDEVYTEFTYQAQTITY